jgi:hypothetical protein
LLGAFDFESATPFLGAIHSEKQPLIGVAGSFPCGCWWQYPCPYLCVREISWCMLLLIGAARFGAPLMFAAIF